jgi:protein CMS1
MSHEEDLQEPLLERLSASPEPADSGPSPKKRKLDTDGEQPSSKRAAKKAKNKKSKADGDDDLDLEAGVNKSFASMDQQLLADYVARQTKKFESELTELELKDKYLPANAIRDTTSWDKPRDLANLPGFLEKFSGNSTKLWSASKKPGAPHTIIVTGAGLRAAELAR